MKAEKVTERVMEIFDCAEKEITVRKSSKKKVVIEIKQMYEFVPCGFKQLKGLSELFGTDDINVDSDHFNGCETCDYGSSYEHTFYITNATVGVE